MSQRDSGGFAPLPDDLEDSYLPPVKKRSNRGLYNLLSALFLLATCGVCWVLQSIYNDPYTALNPFPPNTPFPIVVSVTPIATDTPAPTNTLLPTATATITQTPTITPIPATLTFTPIAPADLGLTLGTPGADSDGSTAAEPTAIAPFVLQVSNQQQVFYITNPDGRGGCAWASITGTVIGLDGAGVTGYGIHIIGEGLDQILATGSDRSAGPGGWELQIGETPREAVYTVQLITPSGEPASEVYQVRTVDDCTRNIAAVRFIQVGQ